MKNPKMSVEELAASEKFQKFCLSPEETDITYWENWLEENPDQKESVAEARKWVLSLATQVSNEEIQTAYHQLQSTIQEKENIRPMGTHRLKASRTWLWSGVAAVLLTLIAAYAYMSIFPPIPMIQMATNYGETQTIILPDSSELSLNANSSVKYQADWDGESLREIWLDGEAYFDVTHRPHQPFIVHTTRGDIKVLGTSFNAYQRTGELEVTLIEGKVRLTGESSQEMILAPGEQAKIENGLFTKSMVDTEPITAWKYGRMIFREATIESIITRLKSDFDLDVVVKREEILQKRVNASIQEINPEELLQALAAIYELDIERSDEHTYIIK